MISSYRAFSRILSFFFFFNDTATTEIYTLSLHDALPISWRVRAAAQRITSWPRRHSRRSEEHTSELQSRGHLVCRLLLEKKKTTIITTTNSKKKNKQRKLQSSNVYR